MTTALARFAARRFVLAVFLVWLAASAAFVLTLLAPGGFFDDLSTDTRSAAAARHAYGLDRPLPVQYAAWLTRAARFDLGESLTYRRPVRQLVGERVGNTLALGACALLLATAIGLPLGTLTGGRRRGVLLMATRAVSVVLLSLHPLVVALGLLLAAAVTGWLPAGGVPRGGLEAAALFEKLRYLALPALALALPLAAAVERVQSGAVREALAAPALLAARARGIPPAALLWRHAFMLALPPVLAVYGLLVGSVLSGSFIVEIVMSWPGLGALMYQALLARDLFLVAGCAITAAAILAGAVFAADLAAAWVDPRIEDHG